VGGDDWGGRKVATSRARWSTRLPLPCWLGCGRVVDGRTPWVVEHDPPRWVQRQAGITRIPASSEVGVSHRSCSDSSGGRTGAARTNATRRTQPRRLEDRPLRW
jgi:hypothetical protein